MINRCDGPRPGHPEPYDAIDPQLLAVDLNDQVADLRGTLTDDAASWVTSKSYPPHQRSRERIVVKHLPRPLLGKLPIQPNLPAGHQDSRQTRTPPSSGRVVKRLAGLSFLIRVRVGRTLPMGASVISMLLPDLIARRRSMRLTGGGGAFSSMNLLGPNELFMSISFYTR
jgi:hypothetical protein